MTLFDDLLNLIARIKEAIKHSDANLQTAKDYTDTEVATLTDFEDLSSGMTATSGMHFDTAHFNRCRRFGHLGFACGRIIVDSAKSNYVGGPIATLPNTAQYGLVGWLYFNNNSGGVGSADRCFVSGNQVCQNYASALPAGTSMEFILVYVVVGG